MALRQSSDYHARGFLQHKSKTTGVRTENIFRFIRPVWVWPNWDSSDTERKIERIEVIAKKNLYLYRQ